MDDKGYGVGQCFEGWGVGNEPKPGVCPVGVGIDWKSFLFTQGCERAVLTLLQLVWSVTVNSGTLAAVRG